MKILIVVRHAKAVWADLEIKDHQRALDPQGIADAAKLGQFLLQEGIRPDLVLSSTALRAVTTAGIIVNNMNLLPSIIKQKDVLYNASAETILSVVHSIPPSKNVVMLVGHNPGVSDFVSLMTEESPFNMGTCDVAIVGLECDSWANCQPGTAFLSRYIENY